MGLLTDDFLAAVSHAARVARERNEEVTVLRYKSLQGSMPLMEEVAVVRKPSPGNPKDRA